jgi:hypothetical protein
MEYTTVSIKEKILDNKDIPQEEKEKEMAKSIISDDAFAVCDFIERLIKKIEHTRISWLR